MISGICYFTELDDQLNDISKYFAPFVAPGQARTGDSLSSAKTKRARGASFERFSEQAERARAAHLERAS